VCRWCTTYPWKTLNKGYNFASDLIAIKGLHKKLWGSKVGGVPTLVISRLAFGSSRTKCHLGVAPVERHKVYYKGEGGGFPQVQAVVSLVSPSCLWFVLAPKVLQLCTNHSVLVLCRSMWVSEACHFFLVPSWSSSTPLYPSKVLRARERGPTFCFSAIYNLGFAFESIQELGVCHKFPIFWKIFDTKTNEKLRNECILIYLIIWCLQPFIETFCVLTWTRGSSSMSKISARISWWREIVLACFISLFYIIVLLCCVIGL